jgi:aldose sugar dehydrogenase
MLRVRYLTLGVCLAAAGAVLPAVQTPTSPARDIATVYGETCANCHGATLTGGLAPSLLDDVWAHGGEDADLARSIREGSPTVGMPPFKAVMTEHEIRAMVIFIREMRERAKSGALPMTPPVMPARLTTEKHAVTVETVVEGLDHPWGLEFLPDGRLLVSERPGRMRVVERGRIGPPITGLPPIWVKQDGGLMDIGLHPDYATNGWVYLAFSEPGGGRPGASTTRIIRGRIRDGALVDQQSLFQASPALFWDDNTHFGARVLFDRQGHLFYSIGDRGRLDTAQDLGSPYGKLHRVMDDGRIPPDNPFVDRAGAVKSIWSYGHRNQQGLAFHPTTGALWSTEHGPRGGDELNRIVPGHNYGWPVITHGMNYDGTPMTDRTEQAGMDQPVVQWTPSIAVSGIAFYTGDRFPQWKHHLFATALAGQQLLRLEIEGDRVVRQEVMWRGYGRVRDVVNGPDGLLYVVFDDPGKIVRLAPRT